MGDYTEYKATGKLTNIIADFILFCVLFGSVMTPIFLAGPIALYANNYAEFHASLNSMGLVVLPFLTIFPLVALVLTIFRKFKSTLIPFLLWLAIAFYVQGNFLVWSYGRFDGSDINWQEHYIHGLIDYAIWISLALLIYLLRKKVIQNAFFIASLLICIQIASCSFELLNSKAEFNSKTIINNSSKSLYSFSKEKNILFILLDEFSSRAFYSALNKNPELQFKWRDFTYYRDTTAVFPTTYPSLPALLTGKAINPDGSMASYLNENIPNSLPAKLQKKGFYSDLVTFHPLCSYFNFDSCQPLNHAIDNDPKKAIKKDLFKLIDLALFRYSPNGIKKLIFNDKLWLLQNDGLSKLTPNHRNSIEFAEIFSSKADANADKPTFKFLHFLIPHGPYIVDSKCNRLNTKNFAPKSLFHMSADCALLLAEKVINKIKSIGAYENTSIFIVADHGTPIIFNNPGFGQIVHRNLHRAYPLLLVKGRNYKSTTQEKINISNQPKSLLDLPDLFDEIENPATIINKANTLKSKRTYYSYAWKHDNWFSDKLPQISEFEIDGDSWDFRSWKKLSN